MNVYEALTDISEKIGELKGTVAGLSTRIETHETNDENRHQEIRDDLAELRGGKKVDEKDEKVEAGKVRERRHDLKARIALTVLGALLAILTSAVAHALRIPAITSPPPDVAASHH